MLVSWPVSDEQSDNKRPNPITSSTVFVLRTIRDPLLQTIVTVVTGGSRYVLLIDLSVTRETSQLLYVVELLSRLPAREVPWCKPRAPLAGLLQRGADA
jgi:hypothetical protein